MMMIRKREKLFLFAIGGALLAIVTASALPVAVLAVTRLLGADLAVAVLTALVCSTFLLCLAGWEIGRHGQLSVLERLGASVLGFASSGLPGPKGNRETFVWLAEEGRPGVEDLEGAAREVEP